LSPGRNRFLTLFEAASDEADLRKVLAGRIDLFPLDESAGQHLLKRAFTDEEQARFQTLERALVSSSG